MVLSYVAIVVGLLYTLMSESVILEFLDEGRRLASYRMKKGNRGLLSRLRMLTRC